MQNAERLLDFLKQHAVEVGSDELHMSAYGIAHDWRIKKNKRMVDIIPVEVTTSRAYVHRLLKNLEKEGKIIYKVTGTRTPTIKIL